MTVWACRAVAVQSGDWWEIEIISGLPDNMLGVSQASRLADVEEVARNVVADLLEVEVDDVAVEVEVVQATDIPA